MKRISRRDIVKGLVAVVLVGLLSAPAMAGGPPAEPGTVSGPVNMITKIVAIPLDFNYDFNGDSTNDYNIRMYYFMSSFSGVMEGTSSTVQLANTKDLLTGIRRATAIWTFWGTVGDSEPGTLTFITTIVTDASNPSLVKSTAHYVVVDGSGIGGLEGITGGGVVESEGPGTGPFVSTVNNFQFRFKTSSSKARLATP